jgi:integrase
MVEIFSVGSFEVVEGDARTLAFTGQAKKKLGAGDEVMHIPTLVDASLVLDGINRLRAEKDATGLTNREINQKWANSCQSAARRLLGEHSHFHELRAMYAVISYNVTLPHSYSLNAFVSKVLGHSSLNNSLNYTNINVVNVSPERKFQ